MSWGMGAFGMQTAPKQEQNGPFGLLFLCLSAADGKVDT